MNKKKRSYILTAVFTAIGLLLCVPAYADSKIIQGEEILEADEDEELELIDIDAELEALTAVKDNKTEYLEGLNRLLSELIEETTLLKEQLELKSTELEETKAELAAAIEDEERQYESMKLRIQYLYEKSANSGLLEALFSADGFMEFLNRAETYNMLTQYDRDMLSEYADTVSLIEEKEAAVKEEYESIEETRSAIEEVIESLSEIYEETYRDLMEIQANASTALAEEVKLAEQILNQEEIINQIIIEKYEKEVTSEQTEKEEEASSMQSSEVIVIEAAEQTVEPGQDEADKTEAVQEADTSEAQSSNEAEQETDEENTQDDTEDDAEEEEDSADSGYTYLGYFKLTAYCACEKCCGQWSLSSYGITASGAACVQGVTVAMGGIDFGTRLSINGHIYTVQDRGTAYGHVDIYFDSHTQALKFGVQYADVYMVN